jgi:hypothetical protein
MNPSDQARQVGVVDSWLGQCLVQGFKINPSALDVICDTDQLAAGYYDVEVYVGVSAAAGIDQCLIQYRDAANIFNKFQVVFYTPGAAGNVFHFYNLKLIANERIRVQCYLAFTGRIDAYVRAVRRA